MAEAPQFYLVLGLSGDALVRVVFFHNSAKSAAVCEDLS